MGRRKPPGLQLKQGTWHIDKVVLGQRIVESTRTSKLEEAERVLAHRVEQIRQAKLYGVRPEWTFSDAAKRFLRENMDRRSSSRDASRLRTVLPFLADLPLRQIHDGTLEPYVEHCRGEGRKSKTINNGLEIVRRILNRAARRWRDEQGMTWLETPPLITMVDENDVRPPYPLSWEEQRYLLQALPDYLAAMALFKVNTGCREQEVVQLRWDWEVTTPGLPDCPSVFLIPGDYVKNKEDRVVVLNRVARSVIEAQRGRHPERVFTYCRGKMDRVYRPLTKMYNSAWLTARVKAAKRYAEAQKEPVIWGFEHLRVHDLKHTFGRRLRAAGVNLETRKVLLGHTNGDITSHYSQYELQELIGSSSQTGDTGIH